MEPAPQTANDRDPASSAPESYPHKTTGEKAFDAVRFGVGEVTILGLTAALAYVSTYGKENYFHGRVPNYLKKMNDGIVTKLQKYHFFQDEKGMRIAAAVASTTTLMHGGNLFVPVMKGLSDHKRHIVDSINERHGKPGELEAGKERLKAQEPERWSDIIKGRLGSWAVVFTSLLGADLLVGKRKNTRHYWIDDFNEKVGRVTAGITKSGHEIAAKPLSQELTALEKKSTSYRFGKILAIDVFATTAALAIWTTISRTSAILRAHKKEEHREEHLEALADARSSTAPDAANPSPATDKNSAHAARLGERPQNYRAMADQRDTSGPSLSA